MLKIVREELGFGKNAHKERPMATHIPYLRHLSDTVIGLENGAIVSTIKLAGLFFQTEDQAELNMRASVQNTIIRALGSSRFSVWSTIVRRQADTEITGSFEDPFCDQLNNRYLNQLRHKRMFSNDIYLSIVRTDMRGALGLSDVVSRTFTKSGGAEARDRQVRETVTDLEELVSNVTRELQKYGARTLGITYRDGEPYSEPCEFFNSILTCGIFRKMRLPRMGIRNYVGTSRLHFSKRAMQTQAATEEDNRYGAMLSIKEYGAWNAGRTSAGEPRVHPDAEFHHFRQTDSPGTHHAPSAPDRGIGRGRKLGRKRH